MAVTLRLYVDTSVLGGYFDEEFQSATRELWRQMERGRFHLFSSELTAEELFEAPASVRELFSKTFTSDSVLAITDEIEGLASAYLDEGIVTPKFSDDARHVAVCTVCRIEYLVSWNFRHLVNVERERGFNGVNLLRGFQMIRIVSPLELVYGNEEEF